MTIKKVTRDIEDEKFNTAVASMMEMVNGLYKIKESHGIDMSDEWRFALESLIQILAPLLRISQKNYGVKWVMMIRFTLVTGQSGMKNI